MTTASGDKADQKRPDVFISYSRKDREFVKRLEAALQARGREAWVDWEGIRPAEEFMQAIFPAIEGTDTFVFVISPDSVTSAVCGQELAHAASHNKRMVPIFAREVDVKAIPEALAKLNWVFFCRENEDFDVGTDTLISAIDTDLDWVHAHTRLLTRAIEWETKGKNSSFVLRGVDLHAAEQWLAQAGTEKERQPTALQTEYIIASRKAASRRQRIISGAVSFALIVSIILTIVAFAQRQQAVVQRKLADERRIEAERQAQIAKSRQLAAQALTQLNEDRLDLALLLAVEACRVADTFEARNSLFTGMEYNPRLRTFLRGTHGEETVTFSPDGRTLAAAGYQYIALWDTDTALPLSPPFVGETDHVYSLAFSPDGKILASAGNNQNVTLWNVATRKLLGQLAHEYSHCVAFGSDGKTLASGGGDHSVILWDLATRQRIGLPLKQHSSNVESVAFNPNGKSLVSGSWDGTIVLWDIATRQPLTPNINTGGGGQVESVAFTPDGKTLASGGGGGVVFCDGATGEPRSDALATDTRGVKAVAFSPDGQILASGGGSNKVVLWNVEKRQQIGPSLTGHTRWVSSVSFSSNKRMLASAGGDNTIILWDIAAPHRLGQSLQGNSGPVESLAFTPDGMTLISCAQLTARTGEEKNQNEIRFWDAATGQERGVPLKCTTGRVSEIAVDPSGKTLAVASRPESPGGGTFSKEIEICLYDVSSRQPRRLPFSIQTDGVYCIAFSPDGKTLVSGGTAKESDDSGEIDFWEVNTGRPLSAPVIGHKRFVSGLEFSPDGKSMASSSLDDTILWDVATHHQRGQPFPGSATAFNPEGKMLAIYVHNYSTGENSIAFRDVETGRLNGQPITGITDVILSMAFSADGRTLVSLGVSDAETRTISLWDVASRRRLGLPFTPQSGVLEKVIFSPNGKMLASGSADGATILWDINFESWLVRAGGIANRNLSTVEWNQYLGPDSRYHRTFPNLPSNEDAPGR